MNTLLLIGVVIFLLSLPYWLPPFIIRLRMKIFTQINGEQTIQLPDPAFDDKDFRELYSHKAMTGRSKGAALSDLFWYWLSPGPEVHPEHLEQSDRYQELSRLTRQIVAISRKDIEALINQYQVDPLKLALDGKQWTQIRLRDAFMPLWSDFFYQLVFKEACSKENQRLIVNHASDVVNALKCCKLRDMPKRNQLTKLLLEKLDRGEVPFKFPEGLSQLEQAHFLQGTFFNTAIVQMSEAMAHLILVIAQHPACQERLRNEPDNQYLDDVINESLRLNPLFGIAHRIVTETMEFKGTTIPKDTVVCFNYPDYHKMGYEQPDQFNPERWQTCPVKNANFIPFGVTSNRPCPAQGLALVAMRQLAKHLIQNYTFASPVAHTRSLPNRGPCLVMKDPLVAKHWSINHIVFPYMKIVDRWEDLYRSVIQLVFGTIMILHAKKLKLCERYFLQLENSLGNSTTHSHPPRGSI